MANRQTEPNMQNLRRRTDLSERIRKSLNETVQSQMMVMDFNQIELHILHMAANANSNAKSKGDY